MKEIVLTQGKVALVDDVDFEWLNQWKWYAQNKGNRWYAQRIVGPRIGRKAVRMHRLIVGAPDGIEVDHKDRDGLHNWRDNLRIATSSQNKCNCGPRANNTSGYKGVYWHAQSGKWRADIKVAARHHSLGSFFDPADAARAYDVAAREAWGEFAYLNFPDSKK